LLEGGRLAIERPGRHSVAGRIGRGVIAQHSKQADDVANSVLAYSRAISGERQ
jgi:hypothetical protein